MEYTDQVSILRSVLIGKGAGAGVRLCLGTTLLRAVEG